MNYLYSLALICMFIFGITYLVHKRLSGNKARQYDAANVKTVYTYKAKQNYMTRSEQDFFAMLSSAAADRYFVFPQVHLSSILDEKIKGQNWNAAFKHINGKSVDYVLCDKQSFKPVYAVELDDYSHNYPSRQKRDREVERMLKVAGIPLVRFDNDTSLTADDIVQRFMKAKNN